MSYADDLLDGFDLLYKRTEGALKTCNEFANFYKNVAKCEREYAKTLSKLASTEKKELQKAPVTHKEFGTSYTAWDTTFTELEKIAEQHNQMADKLENEICKNIANYIKEKSKTKKKLETDGQKLTKDWKTQLDNLNKARSKYVSMSKEAEAAEATHAKGKSDPTMKPTQVAKLSTKSLQAAEKAAQSDQEYQAALTLTNQRQVEFYNSTMPSLLREFQQFEEDRISFMKQICETFAAYQGEKPGAYTASCQAVINAAQLINVETDIKAFVAENGTGVNQPSDIEYVPYDSESPNTPKTGAKKTTKTVSNFGKIGKYKGSDDQDAITSKEWGLSSADASLSSGEKHTKLSGQLEEIDRLIASETKTKDGLVNLVRFYASDPVAQKKAEEQLQESENKLKKCVDIQRKVQGEIDQISSGGTVERSPSGPSPSPSSSASQQARPLRVRGLYDYAAAADTELSFNAGDILTITDQDDSGWWYAELNGKAGFVPNNYVEQFD